MSYWANKAALLDPRCYQYLIGRDWSFTVPAGETWFALNLWWVNPAPGVHMYHRPLDVDKAMMLPAGTSIVPETATPGGWGCAYYARPKLVIDIDPRYTTDPQGLYYERLERLETLPLRYAHMKIPAGAGITISDGPLFDWGGDAEAQYGIIRHTSSHDIAWTILAGSVAPGGNMVAVNTHNEISDVHTLRTAEPTLCPFARSLWNGVWVKAASFLGNLGVDTNTSIEGHGTVTWSKLPSDW